MPKTLPIVLAVAALLCGAPTVDAQLDPGTIRRAAKISSTAGGFTGELEFDDQFGIEIAPLGDLDDDGVIDIAVAAVADDDGGSASDPDRGAVYVLFLHADGSVKTHTKISATSGGFDQQLDKADWFGYGLERLDDFDGDGVFDVAIGAGGDDGTDYGTGAVYLTMLRADGTVKSSTRIAEGEGGFTGDLDLGDHFGLTILNPGDIDGDGTTDLIVSSIYDDDGGFDCGALWVLFLNPQGRVRAHQKISNLEGGLAAAGAVLPAKCEFGRNMDVLGDVDGNGVPDIVVGAHQDPDGGIGAGALWVLRLNQDGTVAGAKKISALSPGMPAGVAGPGSSFGSGVAQVGDLDGNGWPDLVVGSSCGPFFSPKAPQVQVLLMGPGFSVKQVLVHGDGAFASSIDPGDRFGAEVRTLGDMDGDGVTELAIGAPDDDDGGAERGAVHIVSLVDLGTVRWSNVEPGLAGSAGAPRLSGRGDLSPSSEGLLAIAGGRPDATAWLVLGATSFTVPFKGGVMHPHPDVILDPLPLDHLGNLRVPFVWPDDVPPDLMLFMQGWIADPETPAGFSATDGLVGLSQ